MSRADPRLWSLILGCDQGFRGPNVVTSIVAPTMDWWRNFQRWPGNLTPQHGYRMRFMADIFSTLILFGSKNDTHKVPMMPLGDQLETFVQHYVPKMGVVYNRHVLGTKTFFFSWSGNAPEMDAMWPRLPQLSMLNPFYCWNNMPPNRCHLCQNYCSTLSVWHHPMFFYVKHVVNVEFLFNPRNGCLFDSFCLTSCQQKGCFLCEMCCQLRFSVSSRKSMVLQRVQCDALLWLKQNASRYACLSRQMFSMCCSFFARANGPEMDALYDRCSWCVMLSLQEQMAPKWMPFMTDVLDMSMLSLQEQMAPKLMPCMTDVLDVSCFLCKSKWPRNGCLLWQMFLICHAFFARANGPEMDALYDRCSWCVLLSLQEQMAPKWMPFVTDVLDMSCFLCKSKWPRNWCLVWQMILMCHAFSAKANWPDMDALYDRCFLCARLSLQEQMAPKWMPCMTDVFYVSGFFGQSKWPRHGCLLWRMFSMCQVFFGQSKWPRHGCLLWQMFSVSLKWMPFVTDVLDMSCFLCQSRLPRNGCLVWQMFSMCHAFFARACGPDMDISYDRGCQCETIFCRAKCPRNGCLVTDFLKCVILSLLKQNAPEMDGFLSQLFSMWNPCLLWQNASRFWNRHFGRWSSLLADNTCMRKAWTPVLLNHQPANRLWTNTCSMISKTNNLSLEVWKLYLDPSLRPVVYEFPRTVFQAIHQDQWLDHQLDFGVAGQLLHTEHIFASILPSAIVFKFEFCTNSYSPFVLSWNNARGILFCSLALLFPECSLSIIEWCTCFLVYAICTRCFSSLHLKWSATIFDPSFPGEVRFGLDPNLFRWFKVRNDMTTLLFFGV